MHTNMLIQRYTYIHAYMHEFIHKNKPPPLSHRPQTKGKMILIHSFNPYISIAPLYVHYYSEALPTTVTDSVGVYTTKRYRRPYTAGVSKLRPAGRIRPAKVCNPARVALPENINMGRKTVNDFGNYPF